MMRKALASCLLLAMCMSFADGCGGKPRPTPYQRHQIAAGRHDQAARIIEAAGGNVRQEDPGTVAMVNFGGLDAKRAEAAVGAVNRLMQVHTLTLIGPAGATPLEPLGALPHLQVLIVEDFRLSEEEWPALRRQPNLDSLTLIDTGTSDADIEHVLRLPSLRNLSLVNVPLTSAGVERLAGLPSLRRLRLVGTDAGVETARQLVDANPYLIVEVNGERLRGIEATE